MGTSDRETAYAASCLGNEAIAKLLLNKNADGAQGRGEGFARGLESSSDAFKTSIL